MDTSDDVYDIEGFQRRTIRPITATEEVIVISSDEDDDENNENHGNNENSPIFCPTFESLLNMSERELQLKKERLELELEQTEAFEGTTAVDQPIPSGISLNETAKAYTKQPTPFGGAQTPESGIVDNTENFTSSDSDDISLDLKLNRYSNQSEQFRRPMKNNTDSNTNFYHPFTNLSFTDSAQKPFESSFESNFKKSHTEMVQKTETKTQTPNCFFGQQLNENSFQHVENQLNQTVLRNEHVQHTMNNINENNIPENINSIIESIVQKNLKNIFEKVMNEKSKRGRCRSSTHSGSDSDSDSDTENSKYKIKRTETNHSNRKQRHSGQNLKENHERKRQLKECDEPLPVKKKLHRISTITSGSYQSSDAFDIIHSSISVNEDSDATIEYVGQTDSDEDATTMVTEYENDNATEYLSTEIESNEFKPINEMSFSQYDRDTHIDQEPEEDEDLLEEAPGLKNTDKSLYLSSNRAKECPLCLKRYNRFMVNHFKSLHPESEVFVSRISPKMEEIVRNDKRSFVAYLNGNNKYIKALCLFCEDEKDFTVYYWEQHIRSHTGEYGNKCVLCQKSCSFNSHCGMTTWKKEVVDFNSSDFAAYRCKHCNYVQIHEQNVKDHLRNEHGFADVDDEYQLFTLLPAIQSLDFNKNLSEICVGVGPGCSPVNQQPPTSGPSTARIQVLDNRLIKPANSLVDETTSGIGIEQGFSGDLSAETKTRNDLLKIDPEKVEKLLRIAESHMNTSEYKVAVRPWIDGDYAKKPAINSMTQFALYKCMDEKCTFATNSEDAWKMHMAVHIQMIDAYATRHKIEKKDRDELKRFRECCYCNTESKTNYEVTRHMNEEHLRSIFQCAHCFYRTIEIDNIVIHCKEHHPNETKEILLYGENPIRVFGQKDIELLHEGCYQYVTKVVCGQDSCNNKYVCVKDLYSHLIVEHAAKLYKCSICQTQMRCSKDTIHQHLISHTRLHFENYQCLHCKYGFKTIREIRVHMSQHHASQFLFVCDRQTTESKSDCEDESNLQFLYVGNSQDYSDYKLWKCSDLNVLNSMNSTELDPAKLLNSIISNQQIKMAFSGKVPSITFKNISKMNFDFITYGESLQRTSGHSNSNQPIATTSAPKVAFKPVQQSDEKAIQQVAKQNIKPKLLTSFQYKCLDSATAEELVDIPTQNYKARVCKYCTDFIRINNETGLKPFFEHLFENHPCKDANKITSAKEMLEHCIKHHSKDSIVYLQIEKSECLVYKVVRGKFRCQICQKCFDTRKAVESHNFDHHPDHFLDIEIILETNVIESNDRRQCVNTKTESHEFFYSTLFTCSQRTDKREQKTIIGDRMKIIRHHNECHHGEPFEARLARYVFEKEKYKLFNKQSVHMYLFECCHCFKLFDSAESVSQHLCAIQFRKVELRFQVHKLVACYEDKIIKTCTEMRSHYDRKHPTKMCTPVNPFFSKYCGLCNFKYKDIDSLRMHYKREHNQKHVILTDDLLRSLNLPDDTIDECIFAPGCCKEVTRKDLKQIVEHVSNCSRRFSCISCPDFSFNSPIDFAHHRIGHGETPESIINELQNIKVFIFLLYDMHIFFPNGLVASMCELSNTTFEDTLRRRLNSIVQTVWERERKYLNILKQK